MQGRGLIVPFAAVPYRPELPDAPAFAEPVLTKLPKPGPSHPAFIETDL